jgi:iron complex outermembrane receptor protein
MDLTKDWELDLWVYYVDEVPNASPVAAIYEIDIDSYTSLNARLGWRPRKDLELSLVGQNLQSDAHSEYVSEYFSVLTAVERSVYAKIRWDF